MTASMANIECLICHQRLPPSRLRPLSLVAEGVAAGIRADHPDLPPEAMVCIPDLRRYRRRYVETLLEEERGELGALDRELAASISDGSLVTQNVEATFDERRGVGERAADAIAEFGGSWAFILTFLVLLLIWTAANVAGAVRFDPYPFILLNLLLSCVAALQAPVIMMSQHRAEARDRLRAENDYKVNLKAELEIRHLHEKIDHQLARQWERLASIQRIQIEILEEMAADPAPGIRP